MQSFAVVNPFKHCCLAIVCRAPPLCGAIQADPSYVIPTGSQVAARVKSEDSEENWILSEVISFNGVTNKFDVDDIDAEEGKEYVVTLLFWTVKAAYCRF